MRQLDTGEMEQGLYSWTDCPVAVSDGIVDIFAMNMRNLPCLRIAAQVVFWMSQEQKVLTGPHVKEQFIPRPWFPPPHAADRDAGGVSHGIGLCSHCYQQKCLYMPCKTRFF